MHRLERSTAIASLLGVEFGYQSNDKPCRRRWWCKSGISWCKQLLWVGGEG